MKLVVSSVASDETEQAFSVTRIIGGDDGNYSPAAVASAAVSIPLFGTQTLVEVRSLDYNSMSSSEIDDLLDAVDAVSSNSGVILVLNAENSEFNVGALPKKPSELIRKFSEHMNVAYFAEETPSKIVAWMIKLFEKSNIFASKDLCSSIISRCGRSMLILSSEINKLCAFVHGNGRDRLMREDIDAVCSPVVEPDDFGISDAILNCDREKLCETYYELKRRRERPEILLSAFSSVYSDLFIVQTMYNSGLTEKDMSIQTGIHEYRVGLYLKALRRISPSKISGALKVCSEVDALIKSTDIDPYTVIERLLII